MIKETNLNKNKINTTSTNLGTLNSSNDNNNKSAYVTKSSSITNLELPEGWEVVSFTDTQKNERNFFFNPSEKLICTSCPFKLENLESLIKINKIQLNKKLIDVMSGELNKRSLYSAPTSISNRYLVKNIPVQELNKFTSKKRVTLSYSKDDKKNNDLEESKIAKLVKSNHSNDKNIKFTDNKNCDKCNIINLNDFKNYNHNILVDSEKHSKNMIIDNDIDKNNQVEANNKSENSSICSNSSNNNIIHCCKYNYANINNSNTKNSKRQEIYINDKRIFSAFNKQISPVNLVNKFAYDSNLKITTQCMNINDAKEGMNLIKCVIGCPEFPEALTAVVRENKDDAMNYASQEFLYKLFREKTWKELVYNITGEVLELNKY